MTIPPFIVGAVAIYTKNLNFTYVMDTDTFTMSGSAGAIMPGMGFVDITMGQFAPDGTKLSSGLIVKSGNFVSKDLTLNSSFSVDGILFTTKNLNFTYVESTKVFTLTGSASVSIPILATVEVVFGGGDTKGLVITNNVLTSLDMTVNASMLGVGDYSLGKAKMKFTYAASTHLLTKSGTASMGLPEIGGVDITLGGDGTPGFFYKTQTKVVQSFQMSIDSNISIAGMTFARSHLKMDYSNENRTFTVSGYANVNLYIQEFTATLGGTYTKSDGTTGTSAGLVIRRGQLESLDFSINSTIGLAGVSLGGASIYVSYDGPNHTFDMVGTADMTLQAKLPSWAKTFMGLTGSGAVYLGSAKVMVHVESGYNSQGDGSVSTANLPISGFNFESPDESRVGNFDGSSQYLQIPNTGLDNFTTGFSAGMWVYPTAASYWAPFFDFGNGAPSDNIQLYRIGTSNDLTFRVERGSSGQELTFPNALTQNTWQYLAVVQQANGSTTIYKNGVALITGTVQLPNNLARNKCYIGKSNWSADALYQGSMHDFNIWNRPLSAAEVLAAKDSIFAENESGLVASYTL